MSLINSLKMNDFEQTMDIIRCGHDSRLDLDELEIEVNRVNFTDEQLAIFWLELQRVYPSVYEFWKCFDMCSDGFPLIPHELTDAQLQAIYLGAIYYKQDAVKLYIDAKYKIKRTPKFNDWLEQCYYQASGK